MSDPQQRSGVASVARILLGSLVVGLTVPTGIGPAAGGWVAGRRVRSRIGGVAASVVAGVLGVLPWTVLVFLATRGAIEPIGYHDGIVHVGVMTAAPGTFVLWQEVALTGLFAATVVVAAVAGGGFAALSDGRLERRLGDLT